MRQGRTGTSLLRPAMETRHQDNPQEAERLYRAVLPSSPGSVHPRNRVPHIHDSVNLSTRT